MKTISEIKQERETRQTELFNSVGLFWAFSNEQFSRNKTPKAEDEKYVSIGAGGYLPKSKVDTFLQGMETLSQWFKDEVNDHKDIRRAHIAYELNNHEAYYTGSVEDTLQALGSDYKRKEVAKVYQEESQKEYILNRD